MGFSAKFHSHRHADATLVRWSGSCVSVFTPCMKSPLVSSVLVLALVGCAPASTQMQGTDVPTTDTNTVDSLVFVTPDGGVTPDVVVLADGNVAEPTWHGSIAPLLAQRCGECHSAGGSAPFALDNFQTAFSRHRAISLAVGERTMPPFMPGGSCQEFRDDRRLTDAEILLIQQWSANGAPEGTPVAPPGRPPSASLEWVDVDMDIGDEFTPHGVEGPLDQWWCFAMDPHLTESRQLIGYEIVPTDRSVVHHASLSEESPGPAAAADAQEPGPGWHCGSTIGLGGRILGSWAGGFGAVKYASGTGLRINAGQRIAIQVHYRLPNVGAIVHDRTHVRLQFARQPVARETEYYGVGIVGISIPPRSVGHRQSADYVTDHEMVFRGVEPHMHGLGRTLQVELVQGNTRTCLVNVPRWNYHWEEMNFYRGVGTRIPAGSTIHVSCTWDNPGTSIVGDGLTFEDEMCDALFIATAP